MKYIRHKLEILVASMYLLITPVYAIDIDLPFQAAPGFNTTMENAQSERFQYAFGRLTELAGVFLGVLQGIAIFLCLIAGIIYAWKLGTSNTKDLAEVKKGLMVLAVIIAGTGGFRLLLMLIIYLMSI